MADLRITDVKTGPALNDVRRLFREYADSLDFSLAFQGFEDELRSLPKPYQRVFLCRVAGNAAGCIALKDLGNGFCEMKRLYVRPDFRGCGVGRALAEHLIETAQSLGYGAMRLDTIRGKMDGAIALYASLGFRETTPYYQNPVPHAHFMERPLGKTP